MLVLIAAECGMNGYQTIKNIPGANEVSYTNFVANLDRDIAWINNQDNGRMFYRIGKTFQRSENDSLNAGYRGIVRIYFNAKCGSYKFHEFNGTAELPWKGKLHGRNAADRLDHGS